MGEMGSREKHACWEAGGFLSRLGPSRRARAMRLARTHSHRYTGRHTGRRAQRHLSFLFFPSFLNAPLPTAHRYAFGETFFECPKDMADELLDQQKDKLTEEIKGVEEQLSSIKSTLGGLKKQLYARFGNSINLEEG